VAGEDEVDAAGGCLCPLGLCPHHQEVGAAIQTGREGAGEESEEVWDHLGDEPRLPVGSDNAI